MKILAGLDEGLDECTPYIQGILLSPNQAESTTPVFQPVLLGEAKLGLKSGTLILYTQKILHGAMVDESFI